MATWMDSYHRYAVAAAVTDNAKYVDLINHMYTSIQAGDYIHSRDKRISIQAGIVIYDRLIRKEWARLTSHGEPVDMKGESQAVCDAAARQALLLAPYQSWGSGQKQTDDTTPANPWKKPKKTTWREKAKLQLKGKGKGKGKGQGKGKKNGEKTWPKPWKTKKGKNGKKGE